MNFIPPARILVVLCLGWLAWIPVRAATPIEGFQIDFPDGPLPVYNVDTNKTPLSTNFVAFGTVALVSGGSGVTNLNPNGPFTPDYPKATNQSGSPVWLLTYSAIGHTVSGDRPDLAIGDPFPIPQITINGSSLQVDWAAMQVRSTNTAEPIFSTNTAAFLWVEDAHQGIYAAQGGTMTVTWVLTNSATAATTRTITYDIASAPTRRPSRAFWTERGYNAPYVDLRGKHVTFYWNDAIPAMSTTINTNANGIYFTNNVRGVMVDPLSKRLVIDPGPEAYLQGMVVMQYFTTEAKDTMVGDGVVVVEIAKPEVNFLNATIGQRLLPADDPYGTNGLIARVTSGVGDPSYIYQHQGQFTHSPKDGWVFPIRGTTNAPWNIELYWEEADFMGTVWPYERDWYAADWPSDPQIFVRGTSDAPGADVFIPAALAPQLLDFQDPPGHAQLIEGATFRTSVDGPPGSGGLYRSLLKFAGKNADGNDDVWFQAVQSVRFDNSTVFHDRSSPLPWPIGTEIEPVANSMALAFDGQTSHAEIQGMTALQNFVVGIGLQVPGASDGLPKPILARRVMVDAFSADGQSSGTMTNDLEWMLAIDADARVSAWVRRAPPSSSDPGLTVLRSIEKLVDNGWHSIQMIVGTTPSVSGSSDLQISLQVDGGLPVTTNLVLAAVPPRSSDSSVSIGTDGVGAFFRGKLDDLQVGSTALDAGDLLIRLPMTLPPVPGSAADDPPELTDVGGSLAGNVTVQVFGAELVAPGAPALRQNLSDNLSPDHNYLYQTNATAPFNPALYVPASSTNTAPESYVYGVNTGQLEVWWMEEVQQEGMAEPVYFPARPQVYSNVWPIDAAPIVLASGLGAPPIVAVDPPIIYAQSDPTQDGFNPNEEHALVADSGDGWVTYAFRNDLNDSSLPDSSEPYVLVQYEDPITGAPAMSAFHVVTTDAAYPSFTYPIVAGNPLSGPAPLNLLPNLANTWVSKGPGWRDRELTWWALGAGAGMDGTSTIAIHNYYPKQPGFWFPGLSANLQPADGTPIPWLPSDGPGPSSDPAYPTRGTPVEVDWMVSWPPNAPTLQVGQTLTTPVNGLPDVWDQLSVDVVYQQSTNSDAPFSTSHPVLPAVKLFDPTIKKPSALGTDLMTLGFQIGELNAPGYVYDRQGLIYFRGLPPDLSERLYYDPIATNLVLIGQMSETTPSYLLVNALSEGQVQAIQGLAANGLTPEHQATWNAAVSKLPKAVTNLAPNVPLDHAALAAIGTGAGYVTLAFNNATNVLMGVQPGEPITLSVIRIETNLYSGFVVPLEDPLNLLSDQMNILFSESFGGEVDAFEFEWAAQEPLSNGAVPTLLTNLTDFSSAYTNGPGVTRLLLGGDGAKLEDMVDRFFVAHYRPNNDGSTNYANLAAVVGTNWSVPTAWNLAEGWVQRVLNALTPFESRLRDLNESPVETWGTMVQQAGPPYEGPIALNMDAIESVGLIQLYSTVRDRALGFYTNSPVQPPDAAANQQLLLAAGRLHALYMMLGNEAYGDAMDPTIGFGTEPSLSSGGMPGLDLGTLASSLYCFENQVPTLLDEELALLRGRGDPDTAPGIGTSPYFNRLYWNFTKGIDAGEVAYAVNYNIHDSQAATISAGTAMHLYPQGHGDAWGHYLSAMREYLKLLALPGFQWGGPSELPMLLDPEFLRYRIETTTGNEKRVAEAASALVRTGVEIARRAARKAYLEDATHLLPGSLDTISNRAWGVTDWTARAGSAAFYSWALCQSLIVPAAGPYTNSIDASLDHISRDSVRELDEIVAGYQTLQQQADAVDQGLNPLGVARGAVPFDIDPTAVDGGQSHYEQIYQRALVALQNAGSAFDAAQNAGRLLRQQSESALQFKQAMEDQESSFNTQLVAIYGYPYPDDIRPGGTYPQGYDGPDLFHYAYVDLDALGFDPRANLGAGLTVTNYPLTWNLLEGGGRTSKIPVETNLTVTFQFNANGMLAKPADWRLPRRAEGQVQQAYRNYLSAVLAYQRTLDAWVRDVSALQSSYKWYHGDGGWHDLQTSVLQSKQAVAGDALVVPGAKLTLTTLSNAVGLAWGAIRGSINVVKEAVPRMIIAGLADGGDVLSAARAGLTASVSVGDIGTAILHAGQSEAAALLETQSAIVKGSADLVGAHADFATQDHSMRSTLMAQTAAVHNDLGTLLGAIEAMEQAQQQFVALTAQGEQLQAERARVRTVAASRLAQGRYHDMAFRIFRNDALRRYGDAFELAARYAYLAASAYDFETCLTTSDPDRDAGAEFMEQIVRARTVGRLDGGKPVVGAGIGDPGLADVLARMDANWQVLKGRLGFNNPDPETSYFSLRTDFFQILPGPDSDAQWRTNLANPIYRSDNLFAHPIFRRHCLPFAADGGLQTVEPGWVIPFSSSVNFGENFFGKPLGAGQNTYDSSYFATKIRGVGVWFTGYDGGTNHSGAGALANQPRVYLIPAGLDIMRSPSGDGTSLRMWQVVDQAIPMPFPAGDELNNRDWIPIHDSLPGPWAQERRHASLRAYQDHGFNLEELTYNSRLVGRSVWNTQWYLIIPAGTLGSDREAALNAFLQTVTDIKLYFQTYSYSGN